MNEKLIQKALFKNFYSHKYKFTNIFFFKNESDWLSFLSSGYCYEIEIKISKSDFKADFKKEKHIVHKAKDFYTQRLGERIIPYPSWELCREYPELVINKEFLYNSRVDGNVTTCHLSFVNSCGVEFKNKKNSMLPNKFFYAVPAGLIKKEDIPDYAGLLYVNPDLSVIKVKDGKFIHKDILDRNRAFNKTYYVYEEQLRNNLNLYNENF